MNELLKYEGRLRRLELDAKSLKIKVDGLVLSMRGLLDQFAPIEDLQGEVIADQALSLANAQGEYVAVLAKIKAVEKALGR